MSPFTGIRKILVPLDFSESARDLVACGMELVRGRGATLRLLHVVTLPLAAVAPMGPGLGAVENPFTLVEIQRAAEERLQAIAADLKGLSVETQVAVGAPYREIVRAAKEWGADVIVIGTHGRTGLAHVFLGSVAENVVRLAPCPVLTVKRDGFALEPL